MQTHPPYALEPVEFRFRALAAHTARAPLGGPREMLMALLLVARLSDAAAGPHALPPAQRRGRALAARTWLASLVLPTSARAMLHRVIDASGADDPPALAAAWEAALPHVAPLVDPAARAELRRLAVSVGAAVP